MAISGASGLPIKPWLRNVLAALACAGAGVPRQDASTEDGGGLGPFREEVPPSDDDQKGDWENPEGINPREIYNACCHERRQ